MQLNALKNSIFGLDVQNNAILVASVKPNSKSLEDFQYRAIPFSASEESGTNQAQIVSEALELAKKLPEVKSKHVVIAAPFNAFKYHSIRMNRMPENELTSAVHWQIAQEDKISPEQFKSGYFIVGEVKENETIKTEIVGMSVQQDTLIKQVNQVESHGWRVSGIDSPICAQVRGLEYLTSGHQDGPKLIINLDNDQAVATIVNNGQIQYLKNLRVGTDVLISSLVRTYRMTYSKAIPVFNALQLHTDIITQHDNWQDTYPDQKEVEAVIKDATATYVNSLGNELKRCIQYIKSTHPHLLPQEFTAVGHGATASVINRLSEDFSLIHTSLTLPSVLANKFSTESMLGIARISELATVIGLATYDVTKHEQRSAA